jgi:hypothetical protein
VAPDSPAGRDRSFHVVVEHSKLRHIEPDDATYDGHRRFRFPESYA